MFFIILTSLVALAILSYIVFKRSKTVKFVKVISDVDRQILDEHVSFYRDLEKPKQLAFEDRVQRFLLQVRITGINTQVERLDELLVAASAIIPIFNFPKWEYMNLHEVLLYPDSFDEMFNQEGDERTRTGVVGDGPYQNVMVLSKADLRDGFMNRDSMYNTGIHEFVHLVDKTDGAVDGVPETFMDKQYVKPWLNLMQENIRRIREVRSDINPYGATNEAEFFAVVSEYFFKRPDLLQENHPELFDLLSKMFNEKLVK